MTLIKICGITNVEDAVMVSRYADYIGVIVMARVATPRLVNPNVARDIVNSVRGPKPVAVIEGVDFERAVSLASRLGFPIIQYHGTVSVDDLRIAHDYGLRVAPVIIYDDEDALSRISVFIPHEDVEYILIDAPKVGYKLYEHGLKIPIEVVSRFGGVNKVGFAGGINPGNVGFILKYKPYLIDVSSGVEKSPGRKDEGLVRRLYEVVRNGG
jgi:phosphoribosylanthranilate isomerase